MIDVLMGTTPPSGERPPIDLRLARSYVDQERLDDALAGYARVMKWHPKIAEPYEQTMILLARTGAKRARIEKVHRQGLRRLPLPGRTERSRDSPPESARPLSDDRA